MPLSNYGFNAYAAGKKHYGGGRDFPNIGPSDLTGYRERDLKRKARMDAIKRRAQTKYQLPQ